MIEVKRYHVTEAGLVEGQALGRINVVLGADYDDATRLFLDAAERCVASERREKALQLRLTAADERADVLEGRVSMLLRELQELINDDDGILVAAELCTGFVWHALQKHGKAIEAALKPAEAPRNQCDGCQAGIPLINGTHRMGREGGYPDFMGCSAKLYKPAEGGGDSVDYHDLCASKGCDAGKSGGSLFCAAHQSAKSRTRVQSQITAEGLEWMMQNDGYQQ